ncbi:murein DD-endopeptidase MepM/ murein hydrolase activator NlpD [Sinobacterium caligoides]|uniref:Murein DD-endopeptidase MepM/ murein hydrolase activator NlpD n=1 Tax=Sinobacterium caligoides TaxID=933926 RepID=A0A3N2DG71_9GAMM|nr:peptidoglycan DD-metalloendopeptidase family protein [Sinobacterium caligoides]ROR98792.1 murein DD-endopeptidase MepM/ murein hydrolase activator NlpD [Sinobacterium caligoides]
MSIDHRGATRKANTIHNKSSSKKGYLFLTVILALTIIGAFLVDNKPSQPTRTRINLPLNSSESDALKDQASGSLTNLNRTESTASNQQTTTDNAAGANNISTPSSLSDETNQTVEWQNIEVKNGDNLSLIFGRAGLGPREVHHFVSSNNNAKLLRNIYPGQTLSFLIEDNQLHRLRYNKNKFNMLEFTLAGDSFESETITRLPDIVVKQSHAIIDNNLFLAGQQAGLTQNTIMELANIFSGVLDFALDPRKGDSFTVLYEELYLDGDAIGNGKILAAEYINAGESFQAFRYVDSQGDVGYYNENGVSMRKAFLRAPVDFTRISSNFNPNRLHPVFKTKRPHRGIDYAAAVGTPVFASGAGRVTASGYSKANGNYVFIQHGPSYVTKYLHLSKRHVKKGDRVKQKQIIGKVGATGYVTGPHLHYEFLVNGVHRNPRTILDKLPKAKSLGKNALANFRKQTKQIAMQLQMISGQYANTSKDDSNDG